MIPYNQGIYSGTSGAVTTTVGAATTYTGLCLTNPLNSPVTIVLQAMSYAPLVAQTAALQFGIMGGFNSTTQVTQTTPGTVVNNYLGGPVGFGLLATAATLPTAPKVMFLLDSLITGPITTAPQGGGFIDLDDGQPLVVIPPGGYLCFYTSAASVASSLSFSFQWGEQ